MEGRFKWLLRKMAREAGLDPEEVDSSLEYWEAKHEIKKKFPGVELKLKRC